VCIVKLSNLLEADKFQRLDYRGFMSPREEGNVLHSPKRRKLSRNGREDLEPGELGQKYTISFFCGSFTHILTHTQHAQMFCK
jgi:hypothetical protein